MNDLKLSGISGTNAAVGMFLRSEIESYSQAVLQIVTFIYSM